MIQNLVILGTLFILTLYHQNQTNKILSKNTNSVTRFDARKLQFIANRIQIFCIDEKGIIKETCQNIWKINKDQPTNFFEIFDAFQAHKEAIDFLFENSKKNIENEEKSLPIQKLEVKYEEEIFIIDVLFTLRKDSETKQNQSFFLECLVENKTDYYTSLNQLEENNKLQEVDFLNEKWQLTKDSELSEINYQQNLIALNEQLRLNWTNLLADNLKKTATQNFIQTNHKDKNKFQNLIDLSNSFEKISGTRLFPQQINSFLSTQKTVTYLGENLVHQKLIQKLVELAGGKFIEYFDEKEFDLKKINFIFIENNFTKKITKNNTFSVCLLAEPSFLEKKQQNVINNKTNLLIYPLYPFQIWQQLLSFTNTNTMSYHEKIDLSQIYEIVDNEPMLVQNMLQILDKNLREYPSQLQKEFKNGELDTLRQTVHKFKSCTAYTGLTEFNTTLSEIEASQENGWTIAQIKDKLEFVLQAIPVIKVQVEAKLKDLEKEMS